MNRFFRITVSLLLAQPLAAQNVTYLLYERACMNQLIYNHPSDPGGSEELMYAYAANLNELEKFIFFTEEGRILTPSLPSGTITCKSFDLDDHFIAALNRSERKVMIVVPTQSGYQLFPVSHAMLIGQKGSEFWVRSKYGVFIFDTERLENDVNLSIPSSPARIYLKNIRSRKCLTEYAFHGEPGHNAVPVSDFNFIPSIGLTSDRSGALQGPDNEWRLYRVSGKNTDDFIGLQCGLSPEPHTNISTTSAPSTYNYVEPDKVAAKGRPFLTYSEAYHIVRKGENLMAIARTYHVDMASLIKWNNIKDPDKIEVNQLIWYKNPAAAVPATATAQKNVFAGSGNDGQFDGSEAIVTKSMGTGKAFKKKASSSEPIQYNTKVNDHLMFQEHIVHLSESLQSIANRYKVDDVELAQINGLNLNEPLRMGTMILIPIGDNTDTNEDPDPDKKSKKTNKKSLMPAEPIVSATGKTSSAEKVEVSKEGPKSKQYVFDQTEASDSSTLSAKAPPSVMLYKVRPKDSIRSIAESHKVDAGELSRLNQLPIDKILTPGILIEIPVKNKN